MKTVISTFLSSEQGSTTDSVWDDPSRVLLSDDSRTMCESEDQVDPELEWTANRLIAFGLKYKPPLGAGPINAIRLKFERYGVFYPKLGELAVDAISDVNVYLFNKLGTGVLNEYLAINLADGEWDYDSDVVKTYTLNSTQLATLGITIDTLRSGGFGFYVDAVKVGDTDEMRMFVDAMWLEYDYDDSQDVQQNAGGEDDDMDRFAHSRKGGVVCLLEERITDLSASTQLFANAPAGTQMIQFTPQAQDIYLRFDGTASSNNGHAFPAGVTQILALRQAAALLVRAIEGAPTATCFISYLG